jgi:uncharacterized protein
MQTKKIIAAAALLLLPAAQLWADELTAAKKADIKAFVELSGAKNIPMGIANAETQRMAQGIKKADPKFPDKGFMVIRDNMAAVLNENVAKPDGLFDQMAAVYHNNFTHEEIKELLKFHQSPTGKKLQESQAKLGQENMQAAAKWAGSLAPEMDKRITEALAKENIKLPKPPAPPAQPAAQKAPAAPAKPAAPSVIAPMPAPATAPAAPK